MKNYRPVSNLTFISKTIERAVANQLNGHLLTNNLHEAHQSAYKRFHSTETALLKVHNDILVALDERQAVFLLLLDLSAAFDTVNHSTLLSRLQLRYGITGQALFWLKSYVTVPKLSPLTTCYRPLGHWTLVCRRGLFWDQYYSRSILHLLPTVFHSRFSPRPDILNLTVGDESITPSTSCRNIGVVFDDILSFGKQVNALCKTSFWHLRNIWRIRTCLDKQSLEIVVYAFITNKLDFCNSNINRSS